MIKNSVQASLPGGGRPDVVLTLPGRGPVYRRQVPLDDFQRAGPAPPPHNSLVGSALPSATIIGLELPPLPRRLE